MYLGRLSRHAKPYSGKKKYIHIYINIYIYISIDLSVNKYGEVFVRE